MFCPNCGAQLNDGAKFCPNCGAAQIAAPVVSNQSETPTYSGSAYAGNGQVRQGVPAPGFSDRVNHPEILAAVSNNKKKAGLFAFVLVPLPFIGFVIYSLVSGKMELRQAATIGAVISVVFLISALRTFIKERPANTYEATVIDKKSRRAYRHKSSDNDSYYTEYITVIRTADGKKKQIVERDGSQIWAWDYLQVGDRFKYHPQFSFPYELYDKSKAPYIACVSCATHNSIEADRCQNCGLPLIK